MITRNTLRPHVCLRCQRNLSRRFDSASPRIAFQSTYSAPESQNPADSQSRPRREPALGARRLRSRRSERHLNLGNDDSKLHGHRGRKLQERIEDLKLESLGDSAKAVVLRDSKYTFYTHVARMKDQEVEHVDISKQLESERGLVTAAEVIEGINALRPERGQEPQTWEELNGSIANLAEGFTTAQLTNYIEVFSASQTISEENEARISPDDEFRGRTQEDASDALDAQILNATPWMPGTSRIPDTFDHSSLRGYAVASHTVKQKLALKIYRECWHVEVPEISDGLGQFEVQLEKSDLDLLSSHADSPLIPLQNEYLAHEDESIEVFPKRGVLRITTLRHKRAIILQILSEELKSIHREAIPFGDVFTTGTTKGNARRSWRDLYFDNAVLQELGQITSTDVRLLSKDVALISTFIDHNRRQPSTRIDTAKRLLTTVADAADQVEHTVACNNSTNGTYIKYPFTDGLNWWEKLRDWFRWTVPVAKDFEAENAPRKDSGASSLKESKIQRPDYAQLRPAKAQPRPSPTPSWWGEFRESSALFGSILHNPIDVASDKPGQYKSDAGTIYSFSTAIPNLSRTIQKAKFSEGTGSKPVTITPLKYITLKFVPDPFQRMWDGELMEKQCLRHKYNVGIGSKVTSHLPHIEMRFVILEDNKVQLKHVLAITSETKSDIMLPSNGIDLRFQDRSTRRLKFVENLENLQDFVSKSIFDLKRGRLVTPPSLTLPVDSAMINERAHPLVNFTRPTENVRFMFAGLDIRSTLSFNWKNWRLLYTSIEAGKAGGRRSELKLRPIHDGKVSTKEEFIAAATELAQEIGDSPTQLEIGSEISSQAASKDNKVPIRYIKPKEGMEWRVDRRGDKRANRKITPAVFGESEGQRIGFGHQTSYDEDWDEDEGGGFDIDHEFLDDPEDVEKSL